MRHRGDDVLRPEGRVATEEHMRQRDCGAWRIDHRQTRCVKLDADIALDPGKGVLLADRHQHLVALDEDIGRTGGLQGAPALRVVHRLDELEGHAADRPVDVNDGLGHMAGQDRDAFVLRVFLFPGRGLHVLEGRAHHHLDVVGTEAPRRAAAIHRGVAAAEHDDALAHLRHVAEVDRGQPIEAEVNVRRGLPAARHIQIAPARRAAADEDRAYPSVLLEQRLHRADARAADEAHVVAQDVADLFVDHAFGQAKARHLRAHEATGLGIGIEDGEFVAERRQVARHGQRRWPGADAGDALAVFRTRARQARA